MSNSSSGGKNLFNTIASNAVKPVNTMMNTTSRAINSGLESVSDAAESTLTSIYNAAKNTPVINSLLPFNNSKSSSNSTTTIGEMFTNAANTATNALNTATNSIVNTANNTAKNAANVFTNVNSGNSRNSGNFTNSGNSGRAGLYDWLRPIGTFLILIGILVGIFYFFKDQIKDAYDNIINMIVGKKVEEPKKDDCPSMPPPPPMPESTGNLLGKILPTGGKKEVFNVSKNDFTFYDSEPMCRALGAELATYDQVMEAWKKGADWCNYGWAKGQVAIYPTQKDTFDRLQSGTEEDQGACGKPGINGGYFDNPELRFGVNCYGVKPSQNANDERILMEKGVVPRTPSTIKMDQQAQEFKQTLGTVGVLPFNENNWGE